ncbi:hypothetical protein GEMRC1_011926 [Eukaryota sp. GEM-RC1]
MGDLHCDNCEIDSLTWSKGELSGQISLCSDIIYGDDKSNLYLLDNSELTLKAVQFVSLTVECKSMCTLKVPEESTVEFADFVEFLSDSTDSIFINDGITTFDVNSNGFNSDLMLENHNALTFTSSSSFSIKDFNFVKGTVTVVPDSSLLLTDFTWIEGDFSGDITVSNSITAVGAEVRSFTDGTFTLSVSTVVSMAVTFSTPSVLKIPVTKNVIFSNSIHQFNTELFKGLLVVEGSLTLQDDKGDFSTIKNLEVQSTGHLHCDDCEIDSLTWSKGELSGQISLCSDIVYGDDQSNLYLLDNSELTLKAVQFVSLTVECKLMCTLKVPEESTVEFADFVEFLSDSTDSIFINDGITTFDVNSNGFNSELMLENHNALTFTSSSSFSIKDFNFVKGTVTVVPDSSLLLTDFTWIEGDFSGDITVSNSITAVGAEVRSFTDVLKIPVTKNVIFSNSIHQFNTELFKGLLVVEGSLTLQDDKGDFSTIKNLEVQSTGHLHCDDCEIDSLTWSKGKLSGQLSLCSDIDYGDDKSNLYLLDNSELTLKAVQFVSLTVECKSMCTLKVPEESTVEFADSVQFLSDSTDSVFINEGITTFDVNSNGFNSELMFENHNVLTFTSSSSFSIKDFNFVKGTVTVVPDSSLLLTDFTWIKGDFSGDITVSNSITADGAELRSFTDGTFTLSVSTVVSMAVTFATSSVLKVPFTKNVIFSNSIQQFNDELFKGLLIVEGSLTLQDDEGDISTIKNLKVKSTGHLHCDDCEIDSLTWSKGKLSGQISLCSDIIYGDDKSNLYLLDNSELTLKAVQFVSLTVECKSMCTLKVPEESTVEFAEFVEFLSDSTDSIFINDGITTFDVNSNGFNSELMFENHNVLTFTSSSSFSIKDFNFVKGTVTVVPDSSLVLTDFTWIKGDFSGDITVSNSITAVGAEVRSFTDGTFTLSVSTVVSMAVTFSTPSVLKIPVTKNVIFSNSIHQFNTELFKGLLIVEGSLTLQDDEGDFSTIKNLKVQSMGDLHCDNCEIDSLTWSKGELSGQISLCSDIIYGDDKSNLYLLDNSELTLKAVQFVSLTVECKSMCTLKVPEESTVEFADFVEFLSDSTDSIFINDGITTFDVNSNGFNSELMLENHNALTFTSSSSFSIKDFNFVKGTVTVVPDSSLLLTDFTWIEGDFSGDITVSNSITAVGAEVRSFTDGTFTLSVSTVVSMAVTFSTPSVLKIPVTKNVIFSNSIHQFNTELFKGLLVVEGSLTLQDDKGDFSTIKNLEVQSTGHLHCDDCEIDSLTWSKGELSGQISLCSDIVYGDDQSNLYLLDNSELTLKAVQFVSLTVECKLMCTLKVPEESTVEFADFVEFCLIIRILSLLMME